MKRVALTRVRKVVARVDEIVYSVGIYKAAREMQRGMCGIIRVTPKWSLVSLFGYSVLSFLLSDHLPML